MAEIKPMPLKAAKKFRKITVKLDGEVKKNLPSHILADGYNMRQKSKWVAEAVASLLASTDWEGALLSEIVVSPDAQDVFTIPGDLVSKMNKEARRVALNNPSLNANQSTIIRAAINRRLLGFFKLPDGEK
jgi:predicted transcriptional regulator